MICYRRRGERAIGFLTWPLSAGRALSAAHCSSRTCKHTAFIIPFRQYRDGQWACSSWAPEPVCLKPSRPPVPPFPVPPPQWSLMPLVFCFPSLAMRAGCRWRVLASSMISVRRLGRLWNPTSCWTQPCIFPIRTWSAEQPCLVGCQNLNLSPPSQKATGKKTVHGQALLGPRMMIYENAGFLKQWKVAFYFSPLCLWEFCKTLVLYVFLSSNPFLTKICRKNLLLCCLFQGPRKLETPVRCTSTEWRCRQ